MRATAVWVCAMTLGLGAAACSSDTTGTTDTGDDTTTTGTDDTTTTGTEDTEDTDTTDTTDTTGTEDTGEPPEYPQPAGACTVLQKLTCGNVISGSTHTSEGMGQISEYGCGFGDDYTASPEATYLVEIDAAQQVTATVISSAVEGFDVYWLKDTGAGECNPSECEFGEGAATVSMEAGAPQFVTLDNFQGKSGAYELEITCCTPSCEGKQCGGDGCGGTCGECEDTLCNYETGQCGAQLCSPTKTLACGDALTGVDVAGEGSTNDLFATTCNPSDYSGPEMIYTFTSEVDQVLTISVPATEGDDLDVLVLKEAEAGVCDAGTCDTFGLDNAKVQASAGDVYHIVVDGYQGYTGTFDLSLECCVPQCDGKVCGDNGCEGDCGSCTTAGYCGADQSECLTPAYADNDTCETASVVDPLPFVVTGQTQGGADDYYTENGCVGTSEDGEAPDVVFTYPATEAITLTAWLEKSEDDPACEAESCRPNILYATEGCPIGDGSCLMGKDFFNNPNNRVRVTAEADKTYFFVVDGYDTDEAGPFTLHVEPAGCTDAELESAGAANDAGKSVDCQTGCGGNEDVAACLTECIAEFELGETCGACVTDTMQCLMTGCAESCDADWTTDDCKDCLGALTQECAEPFGVCAGVDTPSTSAGGVEADDFPAVEGCPDGFLVIDDDELNNTEETAQVLPELSAPGFCIRGGMICGNEGNNYVGDSDIMSMFFPSDMTITVEMKWNELADADYYFLDVAGETALATYEDAMALGEGPDELNVLGGASEYLIQVACWAGDDQGYLIIVTF